MVSFSSARSVLVDGPLENHPILRDGCCPRSRPLPRTSIAVLCETLDLATRAAALAPDNATDDERWVR